MPSSDHATLYCRFVDSVVNRHCLKNLDQFLAQNVIEYAPERTVGLEASRQRLARWLAAVPDAHLLIEDLVVEGDHLMARLRATGTQRGLRAGTPSTHGQLNTLVFETWSVREGRCIERWLHIDRSQCAPAWFGRESNG
jgi:predicted ester cyclase